MTVDDPEWLALVRGPQPGSPVVAIGGEVVTRGGEGEVPGRERVALVCSTPDRSRSTGVLWPHRERERKSGKTSENKVSTDPNVQLTLKTCFVAEYC